MGLLKRLRSRNKAPALVPDLARLGHEVLALQLKSGDAVPLQCTAVVVAESGQTRRVGAFGAARVNLAAGEMAWCYHPGPYALAVLPFAVAPEAGLRVEFVVDAGDPRMAQQRFDLFLASELACDGGVLTVSAFAASAQAALQRALAEGMLDLPPCTSIDEWHAFRAGFNQLLYTRFGVTVEDCYPIDLHPDIDLASTLRSGRIAAPAPAAALPAALGAEGADGVHATPIFADAPAASPPCAPAPRAKKPPAAEDARALRRLFLELPALSSALRMITPPSSAFARQQELLQRLALAALDVNTMPALQLSAPDRKLAPGEQARRACHAARAAAALDDAWSLLARLKLAQPEDIAQLFDEADRLIANLEFALAERRTVAAPVAAARGDGRREPSLGPEI